MNNLRSPFAARPRAAGRRVHSSCNTFVGVAPLELARQRGLDMEDIDELISRKRRNPRRTTPVKQRAKKIGLELPPTPSGIRQALAGEDDEPKNDARRRLQHHRRRKACERHMASTTIQLRCQLTQWRQRMFFSSDSSVAWASVEKRRS